MSTVSTVSTMSTQDKLKEIGRLYKRASRLAGTEATSNLFIREMQRRHGVILPFINSSFARLLTTDELVTQGLDTMQHICEFYGVS